MTWLDTLLITTIALAAGGLWLLAVVSALQALQHRRPETSLLGLLVTSRVLTRPDLFTDQAQPYLKRLRLAFAGFFVVIVLAAGLAILLSR
jgi:hypothetical protein